MNEQNLQDAFINQLIQEQTPVSIFLKNGVQLQGLITRADQQTIELTKQGVQLIYKHTIATILPSNR